MIRFDNVRKRYAGGHEALKGISFHLNPGELAFLTGHSGAGKSTLLKLIALLERPSSGSILIENRNLGRIPNRQIPHHRRKIGFIFQTPTLLQDRDVFHNVALPLLVAGYHPRDTARRVRAALDQVGLLNKETVRPITLSGGEQQRLGIARAIVSKPPVILADEPTGNLDPELSREIMDLFRRLNDVGVTMMIATHDLELIRSLPYRQIQISQGRIINGETALES
ncbi:MAG: cell division ATP-binding protein FtsE [Gammaproteobacteria bacterium]|nr:cell division ATP-binding protein FtsE [Gammaproteobacteria bacterium]